MCNAGRQNVIVTWTDGAKEITLNLPNTMTNEPRNQFAIRKSQFMQGTTRNLGRGGAFFFNSTSIMFSFYLYNYFSLI